MATKSKQSWSNFVKDLKDLMLRYPQNRRVIIAASLSVGALALLYLAYSVIFLGRVYPNVYIGEVNFGGLKSAQAIEKLELTIENNPLEPIVFIYQDRSHQISPADVQWQVEIEPTVERLMSVGRAGGVWQNFFEQIKAPFSKKRILVSALHDSELLDHKITEIAETIDQPAVNASASFVNDELIINREEVGRRINHQKVIGELRQQWGSFKSGEIVLETEFEAPQIVLGSLEELKAEVERLSSYKLRLEWEGASKELNRSDIRQLIGFVGREADLNVDIGPNQRILTAQFTKESVQKYLSVLARSIDKPARDPRLAIRDGVLIVTQSSQEGRVVDLETSSLAVLEALNQSDENRLATLTIQAQKPVVDEKNLAELGIKERIGFGQTNFTGSPANRVHNIKTGVNFLHSALLKPGEEFSTVATLGAVDNTTGYLPELVIKENRTIPEYGGGLCQVSTTLFRAVLNAGLKVTERRNHSYRVGYYEPPIGLDATIYLPRPDFRFVNDTPAHILVQGTVVGNRVNFELWGTSDGRTSHLTDPVVSNIIQPGDPIYVETDTLPKGEQKQIEKPHAGATAVVHYTVSRDGVVINRQTFKSVYRVWPARFLVGTNENLPPSQ